MKFWRGPGGAGTRLSDEYRVTARPGGTADRIRVVRSEQPSEALPAIVAGSYFDAAAGGPTYFGSLRRWNGSSWVKAKLMAYTGSWVAKPLKRWDGTQWREVDVTGV